MPEFHLLTNTDWRILNVIRQKGEVDRSYIIKETGLTLATVSSSLNRLLGNTNNFKTILITKKEMPKREPKAGPAPILYSVIPKVGYFLGISVGLSNTRLALIDFDFQVVDLKSNFGEEFCFKTGTNMSAVVNDVRKLLLNIREQRPEMIQKLLGIGFACEGAVDCVNKVARYSPAMPFLKELNIKEILGPSEMNFIENNNLSLAMDNVPNCIATAELQVGNLSEYYSKDDTLAKAKDEYDDKNYRARNEKHIVCLNIGTEISVSLILDGKIYRGMSNYSGCIEHFFVDVDYNELKMIPGFSVKDTDPYHQLGFLIANSIGKIDKENALHKLTKDEIANLYEHSGSFIGKSLSYIVNLLNPELIVLTGHNANAFYDYFYPQIRESLGERTWRFGLENLRFERTSLSSNSAAIGAAINAYFELVASFNN
ncbi:MAG: ROK family transcriptional regulator [Desulfosporosinus sp.]|nr:ROK family transcriptional regulator [Desulfosporosinus sp.]